MLYSRPACIEFDAAGKVLRAWGGPGAGYEWPKLEHGFFTQKNVWIAATPARATAAFVKFTADGKFLLSIGKPLVRVSRRATTAPRFWGGSPPTCTSIPAPTIYTLADGDGGDRRVIVFDAETGAFRRLWGGYGRKPEEGPAAKYDPNGPPSKSFSSAACIA